MKPENKATDTAVPSVDELTGELNREKYHSRYKKLLRSTIYTLVIVAAISVLVATLLLPVLQIYGTSMNPNLQEGEIVVSVKSPQFKTGDIIAFYYNNRVLVKRIIGCPGDSVVITDSGDTFSITNTKPETPAGNRPQTGDTTNMTLYMLLMAASGLAMLVVGIVLRKKSRAK